MSSGSRSVAVIWEYFKKTSSKEAMCNRCKKVLKTPTSSTTNLIRHLSCHPNLLLKFNKEQNSRKALKKQPKQLPSTLLYASTSSKHQTIEECINRTEHWPTSHPKHVNLTHKIAKWMATSFHPYSLVEEKGFRELMKEAVPLYQIPSRTTFSRNIIPKLYEQVKAKVKATLMEDLKKTKSLSFTTDMWSSATGDSFLSLTLQYMSENFSIIRFSLGTVCFLEEHTGTNIREKFNNILTEWDITLNEENSYVVHDNAKNMVAAFHHEQNVTSKRCFAHTLQLTINDAKNEVRGLQTLLARSRLIVGHYKHSNKASKKLEDFQKTMGAPFHSLYQDVDTRWNSEFLMLERLLEQRGPISAELAASEFPVRNLTAEEWATAEGYIKILQPFHHATNSVGEDKFPTISLLVPILHGIEKFLNATINSNERSQTTNLARALLKSFKVRFVNYKQNKCWVLAMILDPRFKQVLLEPEEKETSKQWLLDDIGLEKASEDMSVDDPCVVERSAVEDVLFGDIDRMNPEPVEDDKQVESDVIKYLSAIRIPRSHDPLAWWNEEKKNYKHLTPVAMKYLPIPATSIASERLFSSAGNVVTRRRHNLLTEHIEQLVFLHENL